MPRRYSHRAARGLAAVLLGLAALGALAPPAFGGPPRPTRVAEPGVPGSRPAQQDLSGAVQIVGVEGEAIRMRRAPDARSEARGFLAHGTRVEILDGPVQAADGAWYLVAYSEGELPGWVPAEALGPPGAAPRPRAAAPAPPSSPSTLVVDARSSPAAAVPPSALDLRPYLVAPGPAAYEPVRPLPPVDSRDPRFGLVEAFRLADRDGARTLGARHERIAFWWRGLQASPGADLNRFYLPAGLLDRERQQGTELIGLLMSTPDWAAANPADGPRSVPKNLSLPWDHPDNYWGRFVQRMAREYAGRVDDWIIWNEPDITPGDPNAAYYAWAGSVEEYVQLLRVAYRAAKAGNPAARVHLAGLTYWVDRERNRPQYFERLLDALAGDPAAAANNYYFDVATLHLYTDPRALYYVPDLYRDQMRARGLDKPIWVNETNVIPWDDATNRGTGYDSPSGKRCTLADQASYLLQAFGLGLAGGVERIAVYKSQDGEGAAYNGDVDAIERSALVREDGSLRPAYVAYQTAVSYLRDARGAQYFPGRNVETVVVDRPGGQRTTVLWNAAPTPVAARLAVAGGRAEVVNAAGQARPLAAAPDGEYAIALPPATCNTDLADPARYLMGGETYLVVEYDVPSGRPAHAARAEALP